MHGCSPQVLNRRKSGDPTWLVRKLGPAALSVNLDTGVKARLINVPQERMLHIRQLKSSHIGGMQGAVPCAMCLELTSMARTQNCMYETMPAG